MGYYSESKDILASLLMKEGHNGIIEHVSSHKAPKNRYNKDGERIYNDVDTPETAIANETAIALPYPLTLANKTLIDDVEKLQNALMRGDKLYIDSVLVTRLQLIPFSYKIKYVAKNIGQRRAVESVSKSSESDYERFNFIDNDLIEISKGDFFYDNTGRKYSIEEIIFLSSVAVQLVCIRL